MLPMFRRELIEKHGWVSDEEVMNYYALAQSMPGIIAVNVSTFVGAKKAGFLGALFAVLGMILPSIVIILIIALFFQKMNEVELIRKALLGIRIAVTSMLSVIVVGLFRKSVVSFFTFIVFSGVIAIVLFTDMSIVYIVLLSIFAGVVYHLLNLQKSKGEASESD